MAIFDLHKDDLLRLADTQLEELIARLAEADVAAQGHSPADVSWSGSINASDEGIDIHVQVPIISLDTGFLKRPDTILQAKKHSMPKSAIADEMTSDGELSQTISQQASKSGSYIIVSLADDCSPRMKRDRLQSMCDAVKGDPCRANIHLDFYDRSKLLQWLRQHPSVMLWVKGKLGQGYSGWQPYGAWSNPPRDVEDSLIFAPGVAITLPSGKGSKLSIEEAINPMRDLIRSTNKAVRVTGLSGVGKTRIVQALFDEMVGTDALDRTAAVYVDTGAEPDPSATAMLDRLIAEGRRAVVILDNCPSELHSSLASKVTASSSEVSLITVEYDIRDDKPQTTEVVHIEANGPDVAEQLLIRRYSGIGQINARRIAEFADGNARVSLAIAERVEEGESLAQFSDAQLFDRLFEQRNQPDDSLREHAEILSLVYSFSVADPEVGQNELEVLCNVSGHPKSQLFRSVRKLVDRHVVQRRSQWRAVLPHAIANKLAASALESIPVETLRTTFEAPGRERLLMSFGHRLGLMHNHPVAREIVETWLHANGLLGQINALNDTGARMLDYIAPVAPEALLDRIEAVLNDLDINNMLPRHSPRLTTMLNLLQSLAYEPHAFDRCIRLLILVADCKDGSNRYDSVRGKITMFFQPYLSGTHASLDQRLAIMKECLSCKITERRSLGLQMLSTALDGPPWTGFGVNEFGARPRDFGFQPNHSELVEWRCAFVDEAVQLGTSGDPDLEGPARLILANEFRGLWHQEAMRDKLVDAARRLNVYQPWGEGWKSVRSLIYFDYTKRKDEEEPSALPDSLAALDRELRPNTLLPTIMTYVLSKGHDYWALDSDLDEDGTKRFSNSERRLEAKASHLGEDFARSEHEVSELCPSLFSNEWMPYRAAFGRGLAKSSDVPSVVWQSLVHELENYPSLNKSFAVFGGFIEEIDAANPALAQSLLEECAHHPELRQVLVGLHPRRNFTETDLDRCMALLDDTNTHPRMYGPIFWADDYAHLPEGRVHELAQRLLAKPNGDEVVLDGLSMKLHRKNGALDTLGADLRLVGLQAAIQRIARDHSDPGGSMDYHMERVVGASLRFEGNEAEKSEWLDTIFAVVNDRYGSIHAFDKSIETTASLMPESFLKRVFEGAEEERQRRLLFICQGGLERSPLASIGVDVLIEWCRVQNDRSVWASVAAGIQLWSKDDSAQSVSLTDSAIKLLEAAPDPEALLEVYSERIMPTCWSGSHVNVMQRRADAVEELVHHKDNRIVAAAQAVSLELTNWIERERQREQREDEEREQRFE